MQMETVTETRNDFSKVTFARSSKNFMAIVWSTESNPY